MKKRQCPICGVNDGKVGCPICNADGKTKVNNPNYEKCNCCEGSGRLICNGCKGAGYIMVPEIK